MRVAVPLASTVNLHAVEVKLARIASAQQAMGKRLARSLEDPQRGGVVSEMMLRIGAGALCSALQPRSGIRR